MKNSTLLLLVLAGFLFWRSRQQANEGDQSTGGDFVIDLDEWMAPQPIRRLTVEDVTV